MPGFDLEGHLEHRRSQTRAARARAAAPALPGLTQVEINPTELCNRQCGFCPRADPRVYPNRKLHMALETAERLAGQLARAQYPGDIHVTGFGEPLLHPDIAGIVAALRGQLPKALIELTTNGDRLDAELAAALASAGLDLLNVDCYDGPEQLPERRALLTDLGPTRVRFREHWSAPSEPLEAQIRRFGFTNRAGAVPSAEPSSAPRERPCHYPFYKLMIDWDGGVLLCCNDWLRQAEGLGNLRDADVVELWRGARLQEIRRRLAAGDRSGAACRVCDVDGMRVGRESFEEWRARSARS
jgi:MoaA/NifB/PqqE/SkfB family radical SAM enzyme